MASYAPPPRRIVTSNVRMSKGVAEGAKAEPEVGIIEEQVPRIPLLDDQAAMYPVFTHMQVPTDANVPWSPSDVGADPVPHQGAKVQFLDLAPGARVPLHRTSSTDYMIFLSGEVILGVPCEAYDPEKDKSPKIRQVLCRPGDVVVQRGTLHSWENPSKTEWARYVGIGLRAHPVEVDIEAGEGDLSTKRLLPDVWHADN